METHSGYQFQHQHQHHQQKTDRDMNIGLVERVRRRSVEGMNYMKGMSQRRPLLFNYFTTLALVGALPTLIYITFSVVTFSVGFGILLAVEGFLLLAGAFVLGWTLFGISVLATIGFVWVVTAWKTLKLVGNFFRMLWPNQVTQDAWKHQISARTDEVKQSLKEMTPQQFTPVEAYHETFGGTTRHPVNLEVQQPQQRRRQRNLKQQQISRQQQLHKRHDEMKEEEEEEGNVPITSYVGHAIGKVGEYIGNTFGIEAFGYEHELNEDDFSSSEFSSEDEAHENPRPYISGRGYLHVDEAQKLGLTRKNKPSYAQIASRGVGQQQGISEEEEHKNVIGGRQKARKRRSLNARYEGKTILPIVKNQLVNFNKNKLHHIQFRDYNLGRFLKNETETLNLNIIKNKSSIPSERSVTEVELQKQRQDYEGGPPSKNIYLYDKGEAKKKKMEEENIHIPVSGRTIAT